MTDFYKTLFENNYSALCIHHFDENQMPTNFIDVNESMVKLFKFSKEEFLLKKPLDLIANEYIEEYKKMPRMVIKCGRSTFKR